jgi:NhaP-type Na+/H+ or K+/H+ antiporter
MSAPDLAIVTALLFGWGTLSARLERFDVTAPIAFVLAGVLLTHGPLTPLGIAPTQSTVKALAEATLVLVLFSDASRVSLRDLRADAGVCLRLLGVGLPLTIGLGTVLALALFPGLTGWLALLVGAALAPTDANRPVAIIACTVLLSVVLHGLSADPLARRYGPRLAPAPSDTDLPQVAERRLIRHHRAP